MKLLTILLQIIPDLTSLISEGARAALDEYGLEHALALLMTLSLRAAGKRACEAAAASLLEGLMELLESDSPQVSKVWHLPRLNTNAGLTFIAGLLTKTEAAFAATKRDSGQIVVT